MFEGTESLLNTDSAPSNDFLQIFQNLEFTFDHLHYDHRNFDSVNRLAFGFRL
jgi:hypothetical protein